MSQCVPSWHLDGNSTEASRLSHRSSPNSAATNIPMLDYEVAELKWENGQLVLNGLGRPRVPTKPRPTSESPSKYAWDKPRASGTLESIVNQATSFPNTKPTPEDDLVPWFDRHSVSATALVGVSAAMTMDALVPCPNGRFDDQSMRFTSKPVESCSETVRRNEEAPMATKRMRKAVLGPEWNSKDQISVSGSANFGKENSQRVTLGTYDTEVGVGFTSTSMGSPEHTSSANLFTKTSTADDQDSVCHSRLQREVGDEEDKKKGARKSSVSTKRSRAAAIHNQSERKRRDKINQRMKTLQKLVPNSSKSDKASMLDEVIEYLKQLQAQVNMMSRMSMPSMMLPMAMQQQLQMPMMAAPMGMGMGMGMGLGMGMGMGMGIVDKNTMNRTPNMTPNPFMPMAASWDGGCNDGWSQPSMMPDPMAAFLACQLQPMTMETYSRMAALYQQLQLQQPASSSKS